MDKQVTNKRGIYLVANFSSEAFCENLIHYIRASGCSLPIRIIPFGGPPGAIKIYTGAIRSV